jgi:hypothetical protein
MLADFAPVERIRILELLAPVELSTVCFRWNDASEAELDQRNAAILSEVVRRGRTYLSNARVRRAFALRAWHADAPALERHQVDLLFHMRFGYLIVRVLLVLARILGRLPGGVSTAFSRLLDAARTPFHVVNYAGSCVGARIIPCSRMAGRLDRVIAALQCRLEREPDSALRQGMHYPASRDPLFADHMTLYDLYRCPTRHFDFHWRQLTLPGPG